MPAAPAGWYDWKAALLGLCLPFLFVLHAAAQVPPDARWQTLDTPHFRVNFMAGLDSLAHRTAARAEWAYELLAEELTEPPAGRIDIVLTDAVDLANGSATPLPTNRIVLYADPPTEVAELAYTTDWLELLVLHELVHIFHLDRAGGFWGALRSLLGRNAALFPHAYAPGWTLEGLATYYESRLTPGGRVRGSHFDMVLRTAALEGQLFTIDRVSGDPRRWPSGSSRYVYGALFLDYLSRRAGDDARAMPRFVEVYGRQPIPYLLDHAARRSAGTSFSAAWSSWLDSLHTRYAAVADSLRGRDLTEPEILTAPGRDAYYPRYSPDGRFVAYSAATGRSQPSLRLVRPDGSEVDLAPQSQLGPPSWLHGGDGLLYGDLEFRGPHRIHADLWSASLGGRTRRLTRSLRLSQPDLHPDGHTVVAVRDTGGTNVLVVGDVDGGPLRTVGEPSLDVHWSNPRWSPDGGMIAAIRWSPDGMQDVVLVDAEGAALRRVTQDRAVEGAPAWSPDGRWLLYSSDRTGIANLYAFDVGTGETRQVTNVLTGAFHPDVSPDGRWIVMSYYRADGYHVARIPFDTSTWRVPEPSSPALTAPAERTVHPLVPAVPRPYSAWPTVRPAGWSFLVSAGGDLGTGFGAAIAGVDVVQRHLWTAQGMWFGSGGRFEGGAGYRYQGWGNPSVEVAATQDWRVLCGRGTVGCAGPDPLPAALLRRDREMGVSLLWVRQRMRSAGWLRPSVSVERRELRWKGVDEVDGLVLRQVPADVGARLELGHSSARAFILTPGPATGGSLAAAVEGRRFVEALEGDQEPAGYLRTTGRGRVYRSHLAGGSSHVLALRGDVGMEFGSRGPGFDVGGTSGGVLPLAVDVDLFGGGVSFPVRGYPEGVQFGNRVVTASAEYRFPLLRPERGLGLIPAYVDRVSGHLFADGGTAWCGGDCPPRLAAAPRDPEPLTSIGAEVLVETRFGFHTSVPLRVGTALPLQGEGDLSVYVRVGRSF